MHIKVCAVLPVVRFDAPLKERGKENHMMLKAQLGLIGWPGLEHSIQLSKGHNSNSRVGSHHEIGTLLSRGYNHGLKNVNRTMHVYYFSALHYAVLCPET